MDSLNGARCPKQQPYDGERCLWISQLKAVVQLFVSKLTADDKLSYLIGMQVFRLPRKVGDKKLLNYICFDKNVIE